MVDMEPAVDKLEALVISAFFSLTSTRSLLEHKFYAHYTVNSLSVPLCSVNTNTKSCFCLRQFLAPNTKKFKLKSKRALIYIWILMVALESFLPEILFLAGIYAKVTII